MHPPHFDLMICLLAYTPTVNLKSRFQCSILSSERAMQVQEQYKYNQLVGCACAFVFSCNECFLVKVWL